MKLKATIRDIRDGAHRLLRVGYCSMQSLLFYQKPFAYTAGVYGWNFDAYEVDGVVICTGYRGMPDNDGMRENYELIREYEAKALDMPYETVASPGLREKAVNALLSELLAKLKED